MDKTFEFIIDTPGNRLDSYIAEQCQISRTYSQKLISESRVTVNGRHEKASCRLNAGDRIVTIIPPPAPVAVVPEEIPLHIVYEDGDIVVVDKPAGMLVHPVAGQYTGTLVNALLAHCPDLGGIEGSLRPGIVHRLDKDTSGLMVIAKTDTAHVNLSEQFSSRQIEREYRAVIWGHFQKKEGRIATQLRRSPKNRLRMTVSKAGKYSATNYAVIEEFPLFSLIKLVLETGRTHQIRVHMSYLNHPVFGDATYGGRSKRLRGMSNRNVAFAVNLLKQFNRPCLHALTLGFVHPTTNEFMKFETALPEDMQELLYNLRHTTLW